jgi:uncharacterized membrane protein HdeD (DUF308 family)
MVFGQINNQELQKMHSMFLVFGILLIVLGALLIVFPAVGTFTVEILLGFVLLIIGIVDVILAALTKGWKGFVFVLLSGLLCLIVAAMLLVNPLAGVVALTLLLGVFMVVGGIFEIAKSFSFKTIWPKFWQLVLVDGVFSLLIGILIVIGWPNDSPWVIGLLIGVSLLFAGFTSVAIGSALNKLK